jgi:hypothetical protein
MNEKGERREGEVVSNNTFEAIHRLLATEGVVVLHKGRAPLNPVNLFDMLVGQGRRVSIEVDETFIEEMRNLGGLKIGEREY